LAGFLKKHCLWKASGLILVATIINFRGQLEIVLSKPIESARPTRTDQNAIARERLKDTS
jgi:hypothetical protein